jgi:hypothetical protein
MACAVLTAQPLFAQPGQQRLFAFAGEETIEIDPRPSSLGQIIRRFPSAGSLPVTFGGGAYLAWANEGVFLLDTRSGTVQRFDVPGFDADLVLGTDGNHRLLVLGTHTFGTGRGVILVADARSGETRLIELPATPFEMLGRLAYAPETDTLFIAKSRSGVPQLPPDIYDVDVVDVGTGTVVKTLDIHPVRAGGLRANRTGTALLVNDFSLVDGTYLFDVVSGARIASSTATDLTFGSPVVFDEARNRLVAGGETSIAAFTMGSLQLLGTVSVPTPPLPGNSFARQTLDVSSQSATMFAVQYVWDRDRDTCLGSRLVALSADTGQVRQVVDTTATLGKCGAGLLRITEPGPPNGFTGESKGAQVVLRWFPTKDATSYQIEAGSAPGLANLARITVDDTQLTVDGVPPGEYHLRVRAINTIGKSGASQEVQVIVP